MGHYSDGRQSKWIAGLDRPGSWIVQLLGRLYCRAQEGQALSLRDIPRWICSMHVVIESGADDTHAWFHRLPAAIERARLAVSPEGITGYLLFADETPAGVTGMLFCALDGEGPIGLLISTGPVRDRAWVDEYELIITKVGEVYVVVSWFSEIGDCDVLKSIH